MSEEFEMEMDAIDLDIEVDEEIVVEDTQPQYEFVEDFEILDIDHIELNHDDPICIIDTDSVTGDTNIKINGEEITIEEYYNRCDHDAIEVSENNFRIDLKHKVDFTDTLDPKTHKVISKPVTHIYKHLVTKPLFKIRGIEDGVTYSSAICTEDHSIMVMRNGNIVEVTPSEIHPNDLLVINDD